MIAAATLLSLILASCVAAPEHPALSHVARMGDRTPSRPIPPQCDVDPHEMDYCQLNDGSGDNDPD